MLQMVTKPASYSFEMQALNVPEDKLLTYSTITWEANEELVGEEEVPTPHCLVDASGQLHKFRVKVIP